MAIITNTIRWAENTAELKSRLLEGIGTIDAMKSSVDRTTASMGGSGLFAAANKLTAAIDQLGGVTKLTAAEQDRANATLDKAIEKYKVMGMTAPPAMIALSEAMKGTGEQAGGFLGWLDEMGHSFVARVAEGVLLRDAVRELIDMFKEAVTESAGFEDLSRATGLSVEAIQQFGYVGQEFGLQTEEMARGVELLSSKLANGDANATKAVQLLGLSVADLLAEGPKDAFLDVADAVGKVEDPMMKSGIAADLFGQRLAKTLLPAMDDLRTKIAAVPQSAIISDANVQKAHDFDVAVSHLVTTLKAYSIAAAAYIANAEHSGPTDESKLNLYGPNGLSGGSDIELSPTTAATQKASDNATLLQNRLDALRTEAISPLSDAQKSQILELKGWGDAEKDIAQMVGSNTVAVKLYIEAHQKAIEAAKQAAAAAAAEAQAADNVRIAMGGYLGAIQDISGAIVYNIQQELAHGAKVDDVAKEYGIAKAYVEVFAQELKDEQQVIDDTSKAMIAHRETTVTAMDTIGKSLHDGQNVLMGMAVTMGDVTIAAKQWSEGTFTSADGIKGKFQEVDNVISLMPDLTDTAAAHMRALTNDTGTTVATLDKSIGLLDASLRNVERTSSGAFKTTISDLLLVSESAKLATDSVKAFQKAQDSGDTVGMAFAAGGEAMQGVGQFESIQSGQTPAAAGMAQMTETGAALGTMIMPGIGTAIGAGVGFIAGALASVFKDQSISNIARDAGKDFGTTFDKTTSDAILADMKSGMSETASELNNLTGIITDAGGITSANVTLMTSKFHDLFSMLQTGQMTVKQVNDQLQANFPALAAAATDATGRWSDGLKTIITLDQQAGLGTQAIADALKTQGTNLGTSFVAVAAALVDDKNSLAGLGAQAVTTYATMIASGSTAAEALSAISPGLASLQQSYKDLGLNVDDVGLKSLMMQDSINKGNPALIAGINGLASEFVALDNLGVMNTTQLSAMEVQGMAMYTKLQGGVAALGGDTKDALLPMQDYLHNAQLAAEKLGIPLDANTQMLIDQSKDAGIWQTALTPQDKLLQGMQTLVDKVSELLDHLNNIPSKINTTVTTTYDTTGAPPAGDPSTFAAQGGLVTNHGIQYLAGGGRVLAFTPRGSDTVPAMLTPGESVLTRRATSTLGTAAISALNRGGGRSSSGDASASVGGDSVIHTHVYIDGREVASSVNRVNDRTLQMRRKMGRA